MAYENPQKNMIKIIQDYIKNNPDALSCLNCSHFNVCDCVKLIGKHLAHEHTEQTKTFDYHKLAWICEMYQYDSSDKSKELGTT